MEPFRYFLGKALQLAGLVTMTGVVFLFFTRMGMESLLVWSLVGAAEFYGGAWLLDKG